MFQGGVFPGQISQPVGISDMHWYFIIKMQLSNTSHRIYDKDNSISLYRKQKQSKSYKTTKTELSKGH